MYYVVSVTKETTVYGFSKFHILQIVKEGQDKKKIKKEQIKKSEIRVTFLIQTGCNTSL